MKAAFVLALVAVAATSAGCASLAVTDEAITVRTAAALSLNKTDFTVSQRVDEGPTARYAVRTRTGQEFNCVLGGSFNVLGRSVSEAICTRKGEAMKNPLLR